MRQRKKTQRKARTTMSQYARYLAFACALTLLGPYFAVAQGNPEAQSAQDLRRQLDELRVQMSDQMRQMNALQTRIEEMERVKTATPAAAPAADQQAAVPPPVTTKHVSEATTNYQTF